MIGLLVTSPVAAQAQWATSRIEHDWRVTITGNSYGLTQEFFSTWSTVHGRRTTTIYFGQHTFRTRLPALSVAALTFAFVGIVAFFLFAMRPRKLEYVPNRRAATIPSRPYVSRTRLGVASPMSYDS